MPMTTVAEAYEWWDEYCDLLQEEVDRERRAELDNELAAAREVADDPYAVFGVRGLF